MTKRRVIVIGCGGMGRAWIKNVQANARCELAAVVDIRLDAARAAAKEFGLPESAAFADVAQAIAATKPDFICDITIPEAHCPTTVAALELGVPVLGEKPLADSMDAARRMRAAAERSGKLLMTSQSRRYDKRLAVVRDLVRSGAIGEVTTVCCDFFIGAHFGGFRDEMASPLVLDMAIHHFDLARYFTGLDAEAVYAREFNPKGSWYRGDVSASVIFEMTRGVIFTYRGSWCGEGCHTSWNGDWRIIGTGGTLICERDQIRGQRLKPGGKTGFNHELEDIPVPADAAVPPGIAGSLEEFLDALDGTTAGTGAPQGEVHDNIRSLAMVFAAIDSSRAGARVPVRW